MAASVYSRTLLKAAELAGSRANLCKVLRVPAADLDSWIAGKAVPPTGIFLRAVDFIIDETPAPAGSDDGDAPSPRDCSAPGGDPSSTRF